MTSIKHQQSPKETLKQLNFPSQKHYSSNRFSASQKRFSDKKILLKQKIVTNDTKNKWADKLQIYELKILKALMENSDLRHYFNQKYFFTQHYFLTPKHNRFLQIQNLLLDEQETSE